jgi:hypothetical protein
MSTGERRRSVLSRDPLTYRIRATLSDGTPWYPGVGATFQAAYLPTPADPTAPDWKAGTYGLTRIGTVIGLVNVGPGGTAVLTKGKWYEWSRATDAALGVDHIECVGTLIVE